MDHTYVLPIATLWDAVSVFDSSIYKLVSSFISDGMTSFMKIISFIGSGWILTLISVLVLAASLWNKRIFKWALMIAINLAAVSLINHTIKIILHRQRPDILQLVDISGYSFPSWHAMAAMAFFGFLIYLAIKYLRHWSKYILASASGILILLIGISRIYLGVHYASDVLGGYIFGLIWLYLYILITRRTVK